MTEKFPNENVYVSYYRCRDFVRYFVWNMENYGVQCPGWDDFTYIEKEDELQLLCIPPRTLPLDYWDCDQAKGVSLYSHDLRFPPEEWACFFPNWSNGQIFWDAMDKHDPTHQRMIVC